jgi:motility quorum-sensing regulator / GCU-specific mRNA interferase toxin
MEKSTPHCKLTRVKELIAAGQYRATNSALSSANAFDFDLLKMVEVVCALTNTDFFKSMTTYADHTVWQDVYKPTAGDGVKLYIKLTVVEDVLIVSFKEQEL